MSNNNKKEQEEKAHAQLTRTQQKHERDIASKKLKHLKEMGFLPQDATFRDMRDLGLGYYESDDEAGDDEEVAETEQLKQRKDEKMQGMEIKESVDKQKGKIMKENVVAGETQKSKGKGRKFEDYKH